MARHARLDYTMRASDCKKERESSRETGAAAFCRRPVEKRERIAGSPVLTKRSAGRGASAVKASSPDERGLRPPEARQPGMRILRCQGFGEAGDLLIEALVERPRGRSVDQVVRETKR